MHTEVVCVPVFWCIIGDSLCYSFRRKFSTKDQDNDLSKSSSCAVKHESAWWFKSCDYSYVHTNLNGRYLFGKHNHSILGVNWRSWKGRYYSLRSTEMKIKPYYNWFLHGQLSGMCTLGIRRCRYRPMTFIGLVLIGVVSFFAFSLN